MLIVEDVLEDILVILCFARITNILLLVQDTSRCQMLIVEDVLEDILVILCFARITNILLLVQDTVGI
eukprot:g79822.t1